VLFLHVVHRQSHGVCCRCHRREDLVHFYVFSRAVRRQRRRKQVAFDEMCVSAEERQSNSVTIAHQTFTSTSSPGLFADRGEESELHLMIEVRDVYCECRREAIE
jgi:hypothetical protein